MAARRFFNPRSESVCLRTISLVGSPEEDFPRLVFTIPIGVSSLGRSPDCTICLPDPTVSRHHATLDLSNDGLRIVDAGSLHGLRVNGVATQEAFLDERDVVHLIQVGVLLVSIEVVSSVVRAEQRTRVNKKLAMKRTALVKPVVPKVVAPAPTAKEPAHETEPPKTQIISPDGGPFQPQQALSARWLE